MNNFQYNLKNGLFQYFTNHLFQNKLNIQFLYLIIYLKRNFTHENVKSFKSYKTLKIRIRVSHLNPDLR